MMYVIPRCFKFYVMSVVSIRLHPKSKMYVLLLWFGGTGQYKWLDINIESGLYGIT